jgi:hypothetical protein
MITIIYLTDFGLSELERQVRMWMEENFNSFHIERVYSQITEIKCWRITGENLSTLYEVCRDCQLNIQKKDDHAYIGV